MPEGEVSSNWWKGDTVGMAVTGGRDIIVLLGACGLPEVEWHNMICNLQQIRQKLALCNVR